MRDIRFRAWDKKNCKMLTSGSCNAGNKQEYYGNIFDGLLYFLEECTDEDEYELMQFTGLFDTNLVGIYEGDILVGDKYPYFDDGKPNYVAVVEWCYAGFHTVLHCVNKNKRGISDGINEPLEDGIFLKIIGNIYENPELIHP